MEEHTALIKSQHYCAYQERSKLEVLHKLQEWEVDNEHFDTIIHSLLANNYLDESRFAKSYALGKFRIKNWGKVKIKQGLSRKGLSEKLVNEGLAEINNEDYLHKLNQIVIKKTEMTAIKNDLLKKHTIAKYVIGLGYEPELVWDRLENRHHWAE